MINPYCNNFNSLFIYLILLGIFYVRNYYPLKIHLLEEIFYIEKMIFDQLLRKFCAFLRLYKPIIQNHIILSNVFILKEYAKWPNYILITNTSTNRVKFVADVSNILSAHPLACWTVPWKSFGAYGSYFIFNGEQSWILKINRLIIFRTHTTIHAIFIILNILIEGFYRNKRRPEMMPTIRSTAVMRFQLAFWCLHQKLFW